MTARRRMLGFTMIELMTVMVIAGVLLVIAAPAFNDMLARRRIEGRANELVTDLQYARSEAVSRNRNVQVVTGGSGSCYTISVPAVGGSCDCTTAVPSCTAPSVGLKTVTFSNGVTVSGGPFTFEPVRGALEPATAASAAVTDGTRNYTISVESHGRVAPFTP